MSFLCLSMEITKNGFFQLYPSLRVLRISIFRNAIVWETYKVTRAKILELPSLHVQSFYIFFLLRSDLVDSCKCTQRPPSVEHSTPPLFSPPPLISNRYF